LPQKGKEAVKISKYTDTKQSKVNVCGLKPGAADHGRSSSELDTLIHPQCAGISPLAAGIAPFYQP